MKYLLIIDCGFESREFSYDCANERAVMIKVLKKECPEMKYEILEKPS